MRLIELEIEYVRGLPHTHLIPNGQNLVIWGPNGSGKSAVVDALDFLLTGEITRLTGQGTGGITLTRHGPHIDHSPQEAKVRAKIKVNGDRDPIEISRCIQRPKQLNCPDNKQTAIEPVLELAKRGQHVLTRREILKFITAEGSKRAQNIQELLNIKDVEEIRKALVKVEHAAEKSFSTAGGVLNRAKIAVCSTARTESFIPETILGFVNQNRAIFGNPPISELKTKLLKEGLALPAAVSGYQSINTTLLFEDLSVLRRTLDNGYQETNRSCDAHLRQLIESAGKDKKVLRDIALHQLLLQGRQYIDDTGICPLCETEWKPGELKNRIEIRIEKASSIQRLISQIRQHSDTLLTRIEALKESLKRIIAIARQLNIDATQELAMWETELSAISKLLDDPIKNYSPEKVDVKRIANLFAPEMLELHITNIQKTIAENFPNSTPEQTSWDMLTRLEEHLKSYETAEVDFQERRILYLRSSGLKTAFEQARNEVLEGLYNAIRDRFVGLYRSLHQDDEQEFNAILQPDGAALNLEVDFYGRGIHPPQALHSEGHQDSMGVCLYLALAEHLTDGILDLIILDDVVMSVDTDHRRKLCSLLKNEFPNRQFLITTHDKAWATQLRLEGVARSKDVIEFYNWRVETGPQVCCENQLWDQIARDIEINDVPSAAARLRRGSEEFFSYVCDTLRAPVVYKLDGRWELGDLLPSAISRLKNLLRIAKASAKSWDNQELVDQIDEFDSTANQIIAQSQAEQVAINPNVHFNNWANFTRDDFQPVIDAFQGLYGLFCCSRCGSLLFVEMNGQTPGSLRCKCGQVNWNLIKNKAPKQ